jgi:aryl-alcohol dehydrogenase-like predicted oxidoreductase
MFPVVLGGNTFGWTSDAAQSFAVLDAFVDAGGSMIDTADQYSCWIPGNSGGESELILGSWLASSGRRDDVIVATKVGKLAGNQGLSPVNVAACADASLRRLGVDHIDLYYAHMDDTTVALHDSLSALNDLVVAGKVRYLAVSNFEPARLREAAAVADAEGFAPIVAVQSQYNLLDRAGYESGMDQAVTDLGLASFPYLGLANGYLTGKYAPGSTVASARAAAAAGYDDDRGKRMLLSLREIAAAHGTEPAAIALAWLIAQDSVTAPIASARTPEQVDSLAAAAAVQLTESEIDSLTAAGRAAVQTI